MRSKTANLPSELMNNFPYFDEVLHTYPLQTCPRFKPTTTLHTIGFSGNRRMLSELCSIFKVDRYLKLAGATYIR
jgi:hypothetical protein